MLDAGINCAEYYVVNTDSQILALSPCENKIQIGGALTKGLGAGADPDVGMFGSTSYRLYAFACYIDGFAI